MHYPTIQLANNGLRTLSSKVVFLHLSEYANVFTAFSVVSRFLIGNKMKSVSGAPISVF